MKLKQIFVGKFRRAILFLFDCYLFGVVTCAYYISIGIFKPETTSDAGKIFLTAGIILASIIVARFALGIYTCVWRYTRTLSYLKWVIADLIGTIVPAIVLSFTNLFVGLEIFLILAPINCLLTLVSRYCYRLFYKHLHKAPTEEKKKINVAIIGAGQLGAFLANELLCNHPATYRPLFFIDKDAQKIGNNVVGLRVYAEDDQTLDLIKSNGISELFVAVSNLDNDEALRLYETYGKAKCKLKIYDIPVKDFNRD